MWSKYPVIVRHYFLKSLEYRSEILGWLAVNIIPSITLLLIWMSVYHDSNSIHGYTLSEILQYFLLGVLINNITGTHFESYRAREIREGKIDHFMTKPLAYPMNIFLADIGGKLLYICFTLPIFYLSYLAFARIFPIGNISVTPVIMLQFILLLIFAYLVEFMFALLCVFLTFWFEGADGLEHFKWIILTLFSGWMVPIVFMPSWLKTITLALPLRFMYAAPIDIVQHKYVLQFSDILYVFGFLVVMFIVLHLVWKKAVYKYSSAGG